MYNLKLYFLMALLGFFSYALSYNLYTRYISKEYTIIIYLIWLIGVVTGAIVTLDFK